MITAHHLTLPPYYVLRTPYIHTFVRTMHLQMPLHKWCLQQIFAFLFQAPCLSGLSDFLFLYSVFFAGGQNNVYIDTVEGRWKDVPKDMEYVHFYPSFSLIFCILKMFYCVFLAWRTGVLRNIFAPRACDVRPLLRPSACSVSGPNIREIYLNKKTGISTSREIFSFEIERHSVLFRLFDEKNWNIYSLWEGSTEYILNSKTSW